MSAINFLTDADGRRKAIMIDLAEYLFISLVSTTPGSVASMRTQMRGCPCRLIRQYIPKGQRIRLVSEEFVSAPAARFDSR